MIRWLAMHPVVFIVGWIVVAFLLALVVGLLARGPRCTCGDPRHFVDFGTPLCTEHAADRVWEGQS